MTDQRAIRTAVAALVVVLVLLAWRSAGGGEAAPPIAVAGPDARVGADAAAGGQESSAGRTQAGEVWVHVAGSVRRPGLYSLPKGARAAAALDAAGGPSRVADVAAVNLAAPLADGQQVLVPRRGPAAAGGPGSAAGAASAPRPAGVQLSLSSATPEQLEQLDGIGPALARRIVDYRDAHGGFRSIEELQQVEGIGEKRFAALSAAVRP